MCHELGSDDKDMIMKNIDEVVSITKIYELKKCLKTSNESITSLIKSDIEKILEDNTNRLRVFQKEIFCIGFMGKILVKLTNYILMFTKKVI